jgi:Uncharacterized protein conserved in bacteria (DUF2252)
VLSSAAPENRDRTTNVWRGHAPQTQYAWLGDDRIAYQVLSQGPPDLVVTHLIRHVLADFARACAEALAKARAPSGAPVAINGSLGRNNNFARAMCRFARTYADRNEVDHADLVVAVASNAPRVRWLAPGERGRERHGGGRHGTVAPVVTEREQVRLSP